jgi:hypothetical protein
VSEHDPLFGTNRSDDLRKVLDTWAKPPESMVDKLPKPTKRENKPGKCAECGGWHGLPAVHLDYMGHAAVRRALIEIDPLWNWQPVAFTEAGEPLITNAGGHLRMWIRLTLLGKSVLGVGTCVASKPEPEKELIGDALRNAAMSLGIGLSLWAKDEWTDLGTSAPTVGADQGTAGSAGTASVAGAPPAVPASSGHGSPDPGDRPTAGDGPSPADIVERIRKLDAQTRTDVKEYARSKGYKVTPASLTPDGAADLAAWLDRRS